MLLSGGVRIDQTMEAGLIDLLLGPREAVTETDLAGPLDDLGLDKQSCFSPSYCGGDSLLLECMPQLHSLPSEDSGYSQNYSPSLNSQGNSRSSRTSSSSSSSASSATLADLLLAPDTIPEDRSVPCKPPVTILSDHLVSDALSCMSNASFLDTVTNLGALTEDSTYAQEPFMHMLNKPDSCTRYQSSVSSASTLAQLLQSDSVVDSCRVYSSTPLTRPSNPKLASMLQSDSSDVPTTLPMALASRDKSAKSILNSLSSCSDPGTGCELELSDIKMGSSPADVDLNVLHLDENSSLDIENFPLFTLGEDSGIFDEGIAAHDVGSLLEQFEEASAGLGTSLSATSIAASHLADVSHALDAPLESLAQPTYTTLESRPCLATSISDGALSTSFVQNHSNSNNNNNIPSKLNPESEVVKLLKAKRSQPVCASAPSSPVTSPPGTPKPEVIKKIKSSAKRRSTIMLSVPLPVKGERARAAEQQKNANIAKASTPRQAVAGKEAANNATEPRAPSSEQIEDEKAKSQGQTPLVPVKPVKKISVEDYKARLHRRKTDSRSNSPLPPGNQVNWGYYELIRDHDYCQNVPRDTQTLQAEETNDITAVTKTLSLPESSTPPSDAAARSMLKSLLLDSKLSEELRQQAEKDRAVSNKNMMPRRQRLDTDREVVDMDVDSEDEGGGGRFSKFQNEADSRSKDTELPLVPHNGKPKNRTNSGSTESAEKFKSIDSRSRKERHYRHRDRRDRSLSPQHRGPHLDKLPNYYTALSLPTKPGKGMVKSVSTSQLATCGLTDRDRDASPERTAHFDKVPAYFSCFTNSTKYDSPAKSTDPLGLNIDSDSGDKYPWDRLRSAVSSNHSSRSHSPNLVIASRTASRNVSPSRSRSRSHSRSRNPSFLSRSRSPRRPRTRRRRRKSYSPSSSSSSSSRSRSRSPLRSRSRSRSHSRRSTSRALSRHSSRCSSCSSRSYSSSSSRSRSRSRSHSRSKARDRMYRGRRSHRSRDTSWDRWRAEQEKKREAEKEQQIEERRIVYVGGISKDCTRHYLRRTFECFGEITEVSVHFREHGDNYGFVTFVYTCDAFAAIEKGKGLPGCESYDLCFGGRRQFCQTGYADLDGNMEEEEEMAPILSKKDSSEVDFDTLLRQAAQKVKKGRKEKRY